MKFLSFFKFKNQEIIPESKKIKEKNVNFDTIKYRFFLRSKWGSEYEQEYVYVAICKNFILMNVTTEASAFTDLKLIKFDEVPKIKTSQLHKFLESLYSELRHDSYHGDEKVFSRNREESTMTDLVFHIPEAIIELREKLLAEVDEKRTKLKAINSIELDKYYAKEKANYPK